MNSSSKSLRTVLLLLFAVSLVLVLLFAASHDRTIIDFVQYWAGAKLLLSGGDPYRVSAIAELERTLWPEIDTILLWNPPLIALIITPLGLLDYGVARALWLVVESALYRSSAALAINFFSAAQKKYERLIYLITFYPALLSIHDGQVTPFILIGLTLFIIFEFGNSYRPFVAGLALSLTLIKPHLLYLVYLFIAWRAVRTSQYKTALGVTFGGVILGAFPLIFNPNIYTLYFNALNEPPFYWQTPTLGSFLQGAMGSHPQFYRFLPTALGALLALIWLVWSGARFDGTRVLLTLIPLSLVSSPYGWVFDQILLLPVGIFLLGALRSALARGILIGGNIVMASLPGSLGQQFFVWYPALYILVIGLLYGSSFISRNDREPERA